MKSVPRDVLDRIILPNEFVTRSKPRVLLTKLPEDHKGSWDCDHIHGYSKCLSGFTGFHQSRGITFYGNIEHNWGLCIKCAKMDRAIEIILKN